MTPANKGRRYPAEPLTDDEVRALLAAIKGSRPIAVRQRALLAILHGSGIRISECLALLPRDVRDDSLLVRHAKGGSSRVVALRPEAEPFIGAWIEVRTRLGLSGKQPLICSVADGAAGKGIRQPGQPLNSSQIRRWLPKLGAKAGLDRRIHAHAFRHTHATTLVERGVPLHVIAGQLGHASTVTTDLYLAKVAPAQRLAALHRAWADGSSDELGTQKGHSATTLSSDPGLKSRYEESVTTQGIIAGSGMIAGQQVLMLSLSGAPGREAEDVAFGDPSSGIKGIPYLRPDIPRPRRV